MTGAFQLTFVPLPDNRQFNENEGFSVEYRHLDCINFKHDFRRLDIIFSFCRITLTGQNLGALFDLIRAHAIDRIEQVAASDTATALPFRVTGMSYHYT